MSENFHNPTIAFHTRKQQSEQQKGCKPVCGLCAGYSHHWIEDIDDDTNEPVWTCRHCSLHIPYGEPETHILSCDCPDCEETKAEGWNNE